MTRRNLPLGFSGPLSILLLFAACLESGPTDISDSPNLKPAQAPDPIVDSADPDSAVQDTTLDVRVFGDNFDDGSTVKFKRGGGQSGVTTNHTTFVNPNELIANITIAIDADTGAYNIEVLTSRKRRGVGTEMFAVTPTSKVLPVDQPVSTHSLVGAFTTEGDLPMTEGETVRESRLTNQRLWIDSNANGKGKAGIPGVEVCLDLSQIVGPVLSQTDYDVFLDEVKRDQGSAQADLSNVCTITTTFTQNHSNEGQMTSQIIGTSAHAGGKIIMKDFMTAKESWEWRLIWDAPAPWREPNAERRTRGVCVDRLSSDRWIVYNDAGIKNGEAPSGGCTADNGVFVDNVAELWRAVDEEPALVRVADFVVPFSFTVDRLP